MKSEVPSRADVVVIGAGYTGLSAARRLAMSGADVVVVEREHVGFGASSRNAGQVLTGLRVEPAALVRAYGEPRARELFRAASEAIAHLERLIADESIECDFQSCGHIQAAYKPAHFSAFREEQALLARVFDHPVTLVPRDGQRSELGTDFYHGLLVDPRSASLNPVKYIRGLERAARRAGARIATGVAVERLARGASQWRVVTSAGTIAAGDVMAATNGCTDRAIPELQRRLIPLGSYVIVTEPLTTELANVLLPTHRTAYDSKNFLYYFRLTPDRRMLFGGRAEFSQPSATSTRRAGEILRRGMTTIFPELADTRVEYVWSGTVDFTRDELPHGGRLDGMFYAAGYSGHGVAMATLLGDLVARQIGAGADQRTAHVLLDAAWPPIPFHRGIRWLLPVVGAYYRVKDWIS